MILLERGELQSDSVAQMATPAVRDLQVMFSVMCRVTPKLQDAYWLARNFYNHLLALRIDTKELINQTRALLEKDDPILLERILTSTAFGRGDGGSKNSQGSTESTGLIPIERWFNYLFSSVLPDAALLKVWDKFIGGVGNRHLATTAKLIIVALRPLLMPSTFSQRLRQHHHLHHYSLTTAQAQHGHSNSSMAAPGGPNQPSRYHQQLPPYQQLQEEHEHPSQCHVQQHGHPVSQRQPLQTSNNQNQSPNFGSFPTQQQGAAILANSPPSKILGEITQLMTPPQDQSVGQQCGQQNQSQLNYPACCAGVGGSLIPEVENLSTDGEDPLQQSQLATILNQPLSDDLAGPLVAIL
ncbi:TBC1 domain family member 7-like [Tropilaelaps mercedesae]|uniref:TBC1 domain family member 7-like n=1 Tax=Tropilaelaps mercedesae TaxID=418985 RepID=A0A1V9XTP3_9ACAR|nr:TBC1 domain family member 7-like [Tropilaelaps mercedesae]